MNKAKTFSQFFRGVMLVLTLLVSIATIVFTGISASNVLGINSRIDSIKQLAKAKGVELPESGRYSYETRDSNEDFSSIRGNASKEIEWYIKNNSRWDNAPKILDLQVQATDEKVVVTGFVDGKYEETDGVAENGLKKRIFVLASAEEVEAAKKDAERVVLMYYDYYYDRASTGYSRLDGKTAEDKETINPEIEVKLSALQEPDFEKEQFIRNDYLETNEIKRLPKHLLVSSIATFVLALLVFLSICFCNKKLAAIINVLIWSASIIMGLFLLVWHGMSFGAMIFVLLLGALLLRIFCVKGINYRKRLVVLWSEILFVWGAMNFFVMLNSFYINLSEREKEYLAALYPYAKAFYTFTAVSCCLIFVGYAIYSVKRLCAFGDFLQQKSILWSVTSNNLQLSKQAKIMAVAVKNNGVCVELGYGLAALATDNLAFKNEIALLQRKAGAKKASVVFVDNLSFEPNEYRMFASGKELVRGKAENIEEIIEKLSDYLLEAPAEQ